MARAAPPSGRTLPPRGGARVRSPGRPEGESTQEGQSLCRIATDPPVRVDSALCRIATDPPVGSFSTRFLHSFQLKIKPNTIFSVQALEDSKFRIKAFDWLSMFKRRGGSSLVLEMLNDWGRLIPVETCD